MKFKNFLFLLILFLISAHAFAQNSITGSFPPLAGQQVKLVGFQDFGIYTIDSTMVSKDGKFALRFAKKDLGMGYLSASDKKAYFVVLEMEDVQLKGNILNSPESVTILSGKENQLFAQYASEHARWEQALSAWNYLSKIYTQDSLFATHKLPQKAIEKEKQRIKAEDNSFLSGMDKATYISWYLPVRKLVSSVSSIAQFHIDEIPATIKAFRELDYTDQRLYKSGLLREAIEAHFWLIENSGRSLDSVFFEMNTSIDYMIENLRPDERKFNTITNFLFKLLEKRSLFTASEYLALKVLNEESCTVDSNLASQLESYRAMKIGKTAPDFEFMGDVFTPGYTSEGNAPQKLTDIHASYTVLVFGSSWCPTCPQELIQIAGLYQKWKEQNVEVVFVALDENKEIFNKFITPFPFISICDYQKWESPVAKSYHVFATPTIFMLSNKREIILRPNSAKQMDSWIDWYLVKGNN
ncbi:MAG: TlpA disulfide reductase family protein [Lentimicrobium sp.]|jgi:thiol-disulfide isomerase/thioredoxin|nr:TlpA disulfide reductase family protein [Lentimicrobium sp.]